MVVRQTLRTFVDRVDFVTSVGFGQGPGDRQRLGLRGTGPRVVITDLGVLTPDPDTCELTLVSVHPGATVEQAQAATGWPLAVSPDLSTTDPPTAEELTVLRRLEATKGASMSGEVFILDAVRTPIGRHGGALAGQRPDDLAAHVIAELLKRSPVARPGARSVMSSSVMATAPARTTATSRAWRCCLPACRRPSPARRSTASAAPVSRR